MFLSHGDSSKLQSEEAKTLAHLRRMVETGHIRALDPNETETAIRAIDFYGRWENTISAITSLRNVLILVAGGVAFWWATGGENFISSFVKRAAGE